MEEERVEQVESAEQVEPAEQVESPEQFESPEWEKEARGSNWKKKVILLAACLLAVIAAVWAIVHFLIPKLKNLDWFSNKMIALYIAVGVIGGAALACFLFRKPLRTRLRMQKIVRDDPDINEWLVIFEWTPKILYVPTIVASFIAAAVSCFDAVPTAAIGGIWAAIFFLNFLVEEYNVSIKILLITVVGLGFFLLWLHLLDWVVPFLKLFRHIAISMNTTVYLLVGIIGLLAILISWINGLFYYITITPNYMNIQEGPTESGEQIGREDYNSRIDTSDFLERLMGFGRIVITFKDRKREPIAVLVWKIQKKAQMLERVRAKFAIDHQLQSQPQEQ